MLKQAFVVTFEINQSEWNKIVKRSFLTRTNYRFSPGRYQDVSFTYLLLASADRISATATTLVFASLLAGMPLEDAIRRAHRFAGCKLAIRGATRLYEHLAESAGG